MEEKKRKSLSNAMLKKYLMMRDGPFPRAANLCSYTWARQYGLYHEKARKLARRQAAVNMPHLFKEKTFDLGFINKVFASQWLDKNLVVMGTKCNKLIVIDVVTGRIVDIPVLKSSQLSIAPDPCGIHCIEINPSRTYLATGAHNTNDLAVYKLPTFDPICVGEMGHTDWIFDMTWLSDDVIVTGSRDSTIALWRINETESDTSYELPPRYSYITPYSIKKCGVAEKIRSFSYCKKRQELALVSLNEYFQTWDMSSTEQVMSLCSIIEVDFSLLSYTLLSWLLFSSISRLVIMFSKALYSTANMLLCKVSLIIHSQLHMSTIMIFFSFLFLTRCVRVFFFFFYLYCFFFYL